jgi:hypothetical protein
MAAGGWKDWTQGELVTEALFQDIQDSVAFIYASESAANTALTNKVEGTQFYDTTVDQLKIWDGSAWVAAGKGKILQVVSATDTTVASYTLANSSSKLGSLEVSITPSSTSSKIMLFTSVGIGMHGRYGALNFYRDSTKLGDSTAATGNRSNIYLPVNGGDFFEITFQTLTTSMQYEDSPSSTSAITYSVYLRNHHTGSVTYYYNRPENNSDAGFIPRTRSFISAMEIGA